MSSAFPNFSSSCSSSPLLTVEVADFVAAVLSDDVRKQRVRAIFKIYEDRTSRKTALEEFCREQLCEAQASLNNVQSFMLRYLAEALSWDAVEQEFGRGLLSEPKLQVAPQAEVKAPRPSSSSRVILL